MPVVLVADACATLNLLATKKEAELLSGLHYSLLEPPQVAAQVQHLWTYPDQDGSRKKEPATTAPLRDAELLRTVVLEAAQELDAFVEAAAQINDADAACIALAGVRGLPLLTDDKKERRIARELFNTIQLVSTLDVLHDGAAKLGWDEDTLAAVAASLYWRGRFAPPRDDPRSDWYRLLLRRVLEQ